MHGNVMITYATIFHPLAISRRLIEQCARYKVRLILLASRVTIMPNITTQCSANLFGIGIGIDRSGSPNVPSLYSGSYRNHVFI